MLRGLGYVDFVLIREIFGFFQVRLTHVVAAEEGGSVRLPLSSKDGIATTAVCGNETRFRGGTVAALKRNN